MIEKMIREDWSPKQINGQLNYHDERGVRTKWIYQHIYRDKRNDRDLHTHLRCQKQLRSRYGSIERRFQIKTGYPLRKVPRSSVCAAA